MKTTLPVRQSMKTIFYITRYTITTIEWRKTWHPLKYNFANHLLNNSVHQSILLIYTVHGNKPLNNSVHENKQTECGRERFIDRHCDVLLCLAVCKWHFCLRIWRRSVDTSMWQQPTNERISESCLWGANCAWKNELVFTGEASSIKVGEIKQQQQQQQTNKNLQIRAFVWKCPVGFILTWKASIL